MMRRFSFRARRSGFIWRHIRRWRVKLAAPVVWVRRRLRPHRRDVERLTGRVRGSPATVEIISALTMQTRHQMLELLFEPPMPEPVALGRWRLLKLFRAPRSIVPMADLALLPAADTEHAWLDDGTWFSLPEWVRGHVSLPLDVAARRHPSIKSNYRQIERHGYEPIITREEKLFEEFYFRMLQPYSAANFGEGNCLASYEAMRAARGEFDLLFIQKKSRPGEYLAGFIIVYESAGARIWSLGVRAGDKNLVRAGVVAVLYLFAFEFLAGKGFAEVNIGGSRPFLNDGILKFKRRHTQRLTHCQREGLALKILRLTPGVKDFLRQNPFIFRSRGRLHGAVFADAPLTSEAIEALHRQFFHAGLGRLVIWIFHDGKTFKPPPIPASLSGQIDLRSANELIASQLHLP